jgi:hypothetical protein
MTLKNSFCSSPWFHMRINNAGQYEYCRWAEKKLSHQYSIANTDPDVYFQKHMAPVRQQMCQGQLPSGCAECVHMEQHGKVSGRQKQLLKVGVRLEQFEKTLKSSPWLDEFAGNPKTQQMPQDWQIDLGNYCNSACVFCTPTYSSRIATEQLKLGMIQQLPPANWTDSPDLVNRFVNCLQNSAHIQYLHFIGGETLITPAFKTVLQALIRAGLNRTATIGFTTNLSVWRADVVELLSQFHSVNLGMSVECFTPVNDYARWPTTLSVVEENMHRWIQHARQHGWLLQFRTTPTLLTVADLLTVYDQAWQHKIAIESCNFFNEPAFLRPAVLPTDQRQLIIQRMQQWIGQRRVEHEEIVNIRNPAVVEQQIVQDLASYVDYLTHEQDQSWRLPETVDYLRRIESQRGNSVLDYLPDYEQLFRTAGY